MLLSRDIISDTSCMKASEQLCPVSAEVSMALTPWLLSQYSLTLWMSTYIS